MLRPGHLFSRYAVIALSAVVYRTADASGDLIGTNDDGWDLAGIFVGAGIGLPGPWHSVFQHWLLRDNNTQIVTISGVVDRIGRNPLDATNDGDWNIHVRPDSSSTFVLSNSYNTANSDRLVELEIRTPADLASVIQPQ